MVLKWWNKWFNIEEIDRCFRGCFNIEIDTSCDLIDEKIDLYCRWYFSCVIHFMWFNREVKPFRWFYYRWNLCKWTKNKRKGNFLNYFRWLNRFFYVKVVVKWWNKLLMQMVVKWWNRLQKKVTHWWWYRFMLYNILLHFVN